MSVKHSSELLHGDIVEHNLIDWYSNERTSTIVGRIVGKVSRECRSRLWPTDPSSDRFIVAVNQQHAPALAEWRVRHGQEPDVQQDDLEWGVVPNGTWLTARTGDLSHLYNGSMAAVFKRAGCCPRCGDPGEWRAMACVCPWHGMFI